MVPQKVRAAVQALRDAAFARWQRDGQADDRGATWMADRVIAAMNAADQAERDAQDQRSRDHADNPYW